VLQIGTTGDMKSHSLSSRH